MEDWYKHPGLAIAALVLAIISSAFNIKLSTDPDTRADPFTGSEGRIIEHRVNRLDERVGDLADAVDDFINGVEQQHPEQDQKLDRILREIGRCRANQG